MRVLHEPFNNRYEVVRRLGLGTFGETFLARDHHLPSRRQCVIKRLRIETIAPEMMKPMKGLFEREAQTLEALGENSNGCVPKLFANFTEADQFYLVQEFIEGETLAARILRAGPMSEAEAIFFLSELLRTLEYVHSRKVIHRDIKPANIILRSHNQTPVLIDYGIVRHQMTTALGQANASSLSFGTAGYVPIEQIQGRTVFASDFFALGRTAVFALTATNPQNLTNLRTGAFEWREKAPHVSEWLAGFLDKAMRDNYSERFLTTEEIQAALRSLAPTLPALSKPTATIPNLAPTQPAPGSVTDYPPAPRPKRVRTSLGMSVWKPLVIWVSVWGFVLFLILGIRFYGSSSLGEPSGNDAQNLSPSHASESKPASPIINPTPPPKQPSEQTPTPAIRAPQNPPPETKVSAGASRGNGSDPADPARTTIPKTNPETRTTPPSGTPSPAPAPTSQFVRPKLLSMPRPTYNADARMNQISGKVVLSVEVLEDGSVGGITVVSGLGHGLDERAVAAARKGRFLPATRDGKPVAALVKIEVTFDIY